MLIVEFNRDKNTLVASDYYFNNRYEDSWLLSDFAKRVIKESDKSDVIGPHLIISPVLGPIPPQTLSGSVKSLLIMYNVGNKIKYSSIIMGNNCTGFLLEIAREQDITLVIEHPIMLPKDTADTVFFPSVNKYVNNFHDFTETMLLNRSDPWGGTAAWE
jgi:hypothetical protein